MRRALAHLLAFGIVLAAISAVWPEDAPAATMAAADDDRSVDLDDVLVVGLAPPAGDAPPAPFVSDRPPPRAPGRVAPADVFRPPRPAGE